MEVTTPDPELSRMLSNFDSEEGHTGCDPIADAVQRERERIADAVDRLANSYGNDAPTIRDIIGLVGKRIRADDLEVR